MSRWTIDEPAGLDFDGVVAVRATLIAGNVSVLATDEKPSIQVDAVDGPPLVITHEAGMLSVTHERIWEGVLGWLQRQRVSADVTITVPRECPLTLNLVSADAVIAGLTARASLKSGTGNVTLDGVAGDVDANTVSGAVEAQGLDGRVTFTSVSGDLALAGGAIDRLAARTVSGRVAADVDLAADGRVDVNSVSGEVALRVPESVSAAVTLSSATGRVEASFAELARHDRPVGRSLNGTIGAGSGRVSVTTVSGAITLLGRPEEPRNGELK